MALEIINCEQNSEEWLMARLGLATASKFHAVCAQAKDTNERKTRDKYMRQLAGEIITGEPAKTFRNEAMERGKEQEPHLLTQYCYEVNVEVTPVGFLRNKDIGAGASPDGLVGDDGMLEIKSRAPDLMIELYQKKARPTQHEKQLQGNLWISEREWIDIACGYVIKQPGDLPPKRMPLFRERVYRNDGIIKLIAIEVEEFNQELAHMVKMVRRLM